MEKPRLKVAEKVEVKKSRRKREAKATDIMPSGMIKSIRMIYLLILIPISLVVGIVEGICHGFAKGLSMALKLYEKELNDMSWYRK